MAKAWEEGNDGTVKGYSWSCKTVFQQTPTYVEVDVTSLPPLPDETIDDERNDEPSPNRVRQQEKRVGFLIKRYFRGQPIFLPSAQPVPATLVGNIEWAVRGCTKRQYHLPRADTTKTEEHVGFVDVQDDWEVLRQRRKEKANSTKPVRRVNHNIPPSRRGQSSASRLEQSDVQLDILAQTETVAASSGCKSANPARCYDVLEGKHVDGSVGSVPPNDLLASAGQDGLTEALEHPAVSGRDEDTAQMTGYDGAGDSVERPSSESFTTAVPPSSCKSRTLRGSTDQGAQPDSAWIATENDDDSCSDRSKAQDYTVAPGDISEGTPFLYRKAARNILAKSTKGHASCPNTAVNTRPTRRRRRVTLSSQNAGGAALPAQQLVQMQIPQLNWSVGKDLSFAKEMNRALNKDQSPKTPAQSMPLSESHLNSVLPSKGVSAGSLKIALLQEMRMSGADISRLSPSPTPEDDHTRRHSSCPEAIEASRLDYSEDEEQVYETKSMPSTQVMLVQAYQNLCSSPMKCGQRNTPASTRHLETRAEFYDRTPLKPIEHNLQAQTQAADLAWSPWSTIKKPPRQLSTTSPYETPSDSAKRTNSKARSRLYQSTSVESPSSQPRSQQEKHPSQSMISLQKQNTSSQPKSSHPSLSQRESQHAQGQGMLEWQSQAVSPSLLAPTHNSLELEQDIGDVSDYLFGSIADLEPTMNTAMST